MQGVDYVALGQRICHARNAEDMTQAQLAEACNLSTSHIGHVERGGRIPSIDVLYKIASVLHVSMDYLLFDSLNTDTHIFANIESILRGKDKSKVKTFMTTVRALADKIDEL